MKNKKLMLMLLFSVPFGNLLGYLAIKGLGVVDIPGIFIRNYGIILLIEIALVVVGWIVGKSLLKRYPGNKKDTSIGIDE